MSQQLWRSATSRQCSRLLAWGSLMHSLGSRCRTRKRSSRATTASMRPWSNVVCTALSFPSFSSTLRSRVARWSPKAASSEEKRSSSSPWASRRAANSLASASRRPVRAECSSSTSRCSGISPSSRACWPATTFSSALMRRSAKGSNRSVATDPVLGVGVSAMVLAFDAGLGEHAGSTGSAGSLGDPSGPAGPAASGSRGDLGEAKEHGKASTCADGGCMRPSAGRGSGAQPDASGRCP
mmetsp:Transcript_37593/g.116851  ORF Transcript_37593/g.116851 Transcript_37593/m.116851 type:complete len:239 (+) Transcript_37593:503-1219(+)